MSFNNSKIPLDVHEHGRDTRDGLTIIDLSYAEPTEWSRAGCT